MNTKFIGQDFDEFLNQDGIATEAEARAIKRVVVALLENAGMTQVEMAERLQTSRTQVRRLLDPENTSITLSTLQRAADVTGHRAVIGFEPVRRSRRRAATGRERLVA
ncbi:MAG: helix-turn-helix transcriptional regulator [Betaproteobacteria bacterium]|nr:helix-turn-helix transcriptional regulator [Betaproteobacteria bacterium]